jgi:large subunit ribosomal protein L1
MAGKRGKRYREAYARVDREKQYSPRDAIRLVKELATTKADETVEVHIRTGLNVRHADEQLRGTISFPNGLGKDVTIVVFAKGDKAREAEEAGADVVGADDLAERIQGGWTDFDVAIATPDMMPVVGRLGRVLGPQGKMPNPKVGTVTMDVSQAVSESKSGRVEYRTDRTAIIHLAIGKASFEEQALLENYATLIDEIVRAKPAAAKGRYLRTITLTTTMGPGVRVDPGVIRGIAGPADEDGAGASQEAEPAAA